MNKLKGSSIAAAAKPPVIAKQNTREAVQGAAFTDPYAWLKAMNWQEVLEDPAALPEAIRETIVAENAYAEAVLASGAKLRAALVEEMRARIKEDDCDVPRKDGRFSYYTRYAKGGQHPIYCRMSEAGGAEQVLLDGDAESQGKSFFDIGAACHSPDHEKLGWSADETGSEFYAIRVRGLRESSERGSGRAEVIANTDGSIIWMANSLGFYYVRIDENHRPCEVRRHRLGSPQSDDVCVFAANDPGVFVHIRRAQSGRFAIITVEDHDSCACHLIDLADGGAKPRLIEPRRQGLRYDIEPHGAELFILTNADGAEDFKIVRAPLANPKKANWSSIVPHRAGRLIIGMAVYPDYLVRIEREAGLPRIVVHHLTSGIEHAIAFPEAAYSLGIEERLEYDSHTLRFAYSSMTTPWETYDYDLAVGTRVLRKRQDIPCGHDPSRYVTRRLFARAPDGEEVPVSILHRADLAPNAQTPLWLYGYGAYGSHVPASFASERLSLVDRGFVYAIAHVRGGTEKGWRWYTEGKLGKKPNSFADFLAAARHLIAEGYTGKGRIVAQGVSAGGMLVGAAVNMAPELFAGIVADVPFVDVLNTMLDASLPLTPPEWLEWGNPAADPQVFALMRSYSPYENVKPQHYPPVLALAGLTDSRVTYWEPLKWIAKLRATMTGGGPVLVSTNMGVGHGGAPGRFDHLEEIALQYAFAILCVGGAFDTVS